jgi:ubiquinone/menaquinone biosynthesis C-methylase UbiE
MSCRHAQLERRKRIKYVHARAEATGMPDASFDLVTSNFVIHECPPSAIDDMIQEAFRLVSPGGVYAITDNDPRYVRSRTS